MQWCGEVVYVMQCWSIIWSKVTAVTCARLCRGKRCETPSSQAEVCILLTLHTFHSLSSDNRCCLFCLRMFSTCIILIQIFLQLRPMLRLNCEITASLALRWHIGLSPRSHWHCQYWDGWPSSSVLNTMYFMLRTVYWDQLYETIFFYWSTRWWRQ